MRPRWSSKLSRQHDRYDPGPIELSATRGTNADAKRHKKTVQATVPKCSPFFFVPFVTPRLCLLWFT